LRFVWPALRRNSTSPRPFLRLFLFRSFESVSILAHSRSNGHRELRRSRKAEACLLTHAKGDGMGDWFRQARWALFGLLVLMTLMAPASAQTKNSAAQESAAQSNARTAAPARA
jgi:hypothetical protein